MLRKSATLAVPTESEISFSFRKWKPTETMEFCVDLKLPSDWKIKIHSASPGQLVELASRADGTEDFVKEVALRLKQVSVEAEHCIDLLNTLVFWCKLGFFRNPQLSDSLNDILIATVEGLERRLLSSSNSTSYKETLLNLPFSHKMIIMRVFKASEQQVKRIQKRVKPNKATWETMEPIDMESKEREKFLKGEEKILQTRFVCATINKPPVGYRIVPFMNLSLLENIELASADELAQIALIFESVPDQFLYSSTLRETAETAFLKAILKLTDINIIPFVAAIRKFESSALLRQVWVQKLVPEVVATMKNILSYDHRYLPLELIGSSSTEKAVYLVCGVLTSGQVRITRSLADSLFIPLRNQKMSYNLKAKLCDAMIQAGVEDETLLKEWMSSQSLSKGSVSELALLGMVMIRLMNDKYSHLICDVLLSKVTESTSRRHAFQATLLLKKCHFDEKDQRYVGLLENLSPELKALVIC